MSGLREYSALTTKVKGMQTRLLTEEDYREILSQKDVASAISVLQRHEGYQDILTDEAYKAHRLSAEPDIARATYRDFESIYHFANQKQRRFLRFYSRRFECYTLKHVLEDITSSGRVDPGILISRDFYDRYSDLDLTKLSQATSREEVLDALSDTPYYKILTPLFASNETGLFDYETAIDQFYFSSLWKHNGGLVKKKNIKIVKEAYGTRFDMLNLMWISRAHRSYNMSRTDIYAMLIPFNYKLKSEEIGRLLDAETDADYQEVLDATYYGRKYGEYMAPEKLGFEYNYLLRHILDGLARRDPYSIATPYRYLYMKEHEVSRLTVALECVHYHTPVDEALEMILRI